MTSITPADKPQPPVLIPQTADANPIVSTEKQLVFTTDTNGEELLCVQDNVNLNASGVWDMEANKQVMMAWEKDYMCACVDALKITKGDSVLEIGFGCGFSANQVQSYRPRSHTIIECDPA